MLGTDGAPLQGSSVGFENFQTAIYRHVSEVYETNTIVLQCGRVGIKN